MPRFPTLLAFFRESRQPLLYTFIAAPALSVCTALPVTIIRVTSPFRSPFNSMSSYRLLVTVIRLIHRECYG